MASKSKLEELNLTRDELKRLEDALKDEKFRKMFCEYAEEISDPENRRRYEEEIAQMEKERGMDVTFVRPEPGYVLKTSIDGDTKAFVNISKSEKIDKPSSERKQNDEGKNGLMWHIPHSFAPPREDHDKQKNRCQVYDFVVHPDTYRMAENNARFKKLVEDTAMDGIERQFQVKLDRNNIKRPKMQFKGVPSATVIRSRNASGPQPEHDASGLLKDMPYPYDDRSTVEKMEDQEQKLVTEKENKNLGDGMSDNKSHTKGKKDDAAVPKYTIIHRSELNMQEYRDAPDAKPSTRPQELVIKIELPLLKSSAEVSLDIFEKHLTLESSPPAAYRLELTLPYPVDDSKGKAKFDKQKRTLIVTLPVVPGDLPSMPSYITGNTNENESESSGISTHSSLKGDTSAENPLTQVVSDGTDNRPGEIGIIQQEDMTGVERVNGMTCPDSVNSEDSGKLFTTVVSYSLPDFSFTQDTETVSFVLKINNVTEKSIKQETPSSHEIDFVCTSQGEGGFPLHFRLFLRFAERCKVVPEHSTVDVTAENVVLLLLKERESRGLWDVFWAGLHSDNLEKHLFLTTSNLQQQLRELDERCIGMNQAPMPQTDIAEPDSSCSLKVTAMDEKKLTIKITPLPGQSKNRVKKESGKFDTQSSPEIEVDQTHLCPSLHSILKHESSDDSSNHHSSNEEEEEFPPVGSLGRHHTVSFSKHIDQATFRSSATVSSLKTTLKSKRKRECRLERLKEKAISQSEHNSAGLEGCNEDHLPNLSDSPSPIEDNAVVGEVRRSPDNPNSADAAAPSGIDFRTTSVDSCSCKENFNQKNKTLNCKVDRDSGSENRGEMNEVEISCNQDSSCDKDRTSDVHPVSDKIEGSCEEKSTGDKKPGNVADQIKSKLAETTSAGHSDDSDDEEEGDQDKETDDNCTSPPLQQPDKTHNEHRTECAFQFTNAVMFDLDVE